MIRTDIDGFRYWSEKHHIRIYYLFEYNSTYDS